MAYSRAASYTKFWFAYSLAVFILLFASCTVVRNYPKNTPFIYETDIDIVGKYNTDERKELINQLEDQLHDSVRVRKIPKLFYAVLKNPPVYDSINADKSITFMKALLHSLGYYRDSIYYVDTVLVRGDQHRTSLKFLVDPGKLTTLDSVWYNLDKDTILTDTGRYITGSDTLQEITLKARNESLLKEGQPFSMPQISSELTRLVELYRNNGYLRFSFDDLVAVWDTVGLALLRPTLDPIEQARQLQELQRRRANPTADVEIRLRANPDTTHLIQYHVGNITVYPDLTSDTLDYEPIVRLRNNIRIISYYDLFKPRAITENIYLQKGDMYRQRNYLRTLNRFNQLGAWRLATVEQVPRPTGDTVDFIIKLIPARKYLFTFNVEGSKNWGNPFTTGDLLGFGVNLGLQNRNFARRANQASTNLRYGVELNAADDLLQTLQASAGHTVSFPRIIPRRNFFPAKWKEDARTVFAINAGNVDRRNYFNLTTFSTSWGYNFNWKNKLLSIRFPNVEYSFLNSRDSLNELIKRNRSFRYIFNSGLITSVLSSFTITFPKPKTTSLVRLNFEGAGLISGFFDNTFLRENLYRFIKMDAEFRQTYKLTPRTEFAWRALAGSGIGLPRNLKGTTEKDSLNFYLPFFRQYFAGGSNSMRAWGLRKLGPGSAVKSFASTIAPDRFGDLQLELNAEYRFYVTEIAGARINSALFTDIGNVWFLRYNPDFEGGEFRFNKLWKDLAIGMGTGLRVDFGLFVVRLDYAYKVKNPSPEDPQYQNKWFYDWRLFKGQLQLGVNYPF